MITVVTYLKTPELHWRGCCHSDHILWLFRSTSSAQMAARHKQKCAPMSNYLIMENTFFQFHFISFRMSFNSHLNVIQSSLSLDYSTLFRIYSASCKNPSMEVLSLQSSFHPSSISLLYPTIPGWPGCAYVCPMNESIFSFQHCLNFQLKMSRVFPCSEGPSITGPQPVPPQARVSATIFLWS